MVPKQQGDVGIEANKNRENLSDDTICVPNPALAFSNTLVLEDLN